MTYDTLDHAPDDQPKKDLPNKDSVFVPGGGFVLPKHPDYASLRPNLGWISADRVKATLQNTTQYYGPGCHKSSHGHIARWQCEHSHD